MTTATEKRVAPGALYIPLAKIWFVFAAFALNFVLPNLLGPDEVGDFGVVIRLASLLNMVMLTVPLLAVSKFISEDESRLGAVQRTGLLLQLAFGGTLALAYFLAAPSIAGWFNDPSLAPLIRATSPIPLCYGLYAVFIGSLNGTRAFRTQALFDMGYATLRVTLIVGAVVLGFGVWGSFVGFSVAAILILILSALVIGRWRTSTAFPIAPLVAFALPLIGVVILQNALLSADLFWVKGLADLERSKFLSGAYFAFLNLAAVPYMLIVSVNFILFPLVSRTTLVEDQELSRRYIGTSLRVTLLLALAGESVIAAAPQAIVRTVYPSKPEYLSEASVLIPLAAAYAVLCLVSVAITVVNASGRPFRSMAGVALAVVVQSAAVAILWPRLGLPGAGVASLVGFSSGLVFFVVYLHRTYGAGFPPLSVVRGGLAAVAAVGAVRLSAPPEAHSIFHAALGGLVYVIVLVITRELRAEDLRQLRELR